MTMENIGLRMHRSTLESLPAAPLPEGFCFRTYEPGRSNQPDDRGIWVQLYRAAERYVEITPALFEREFYGDEAALEQRMLFLCRSNGTAVGTSTAWYDDIAQRAEAGRVHWVAIHPDFQGRGLGRCLLAETLGVLRRLGHTSAYLMTSSARLPALSLYLSFGFTPQIESAEQYKAWQQLIPLLRPEFHAVIAQAASEYSGPGMA